MKVGVIGLDLPGGKVRYDDHKFLELVKKCQPRKISPYYMEFLIGDLTKAEAWVVAAAKIWDLLIHDLDKVERRRERTTDPGERAILDRGIAWLEQERPLSDLELTPAELAVWRALSPLSLKPTLIIQDLPPLPELIAMLLQKAGIIFFYTADSKEVHARPVAKQADIITCASRIHSDLARGFIRADIVKYQDFLRVHNFQEARCRKLVQMVDRNYRIQAGDIIEIHFNV